jgi:type IV pilus assembly protein PilF
MRSISCLLLLGVLAFSGGCATSPDKEGELSDSQRVSELAEVQTNLGIAYMRGGQNDLAYTRLQKALQLEPRYSKAHYVIALLYERLGELQKAEQHYEDAVRYNPRDSSAQNNYGNYLCRKGRIEEAEDRFMKALDNPLYATPEVAYANAGLCVLKAGDLPQADVYLREALARNPNIPAALYAMSDISFQRGEELSARAYLERFREVGNDTSRSLWLGVRIERALGDQDAAASYALLLRTQYPDSPEAKLLKKSNSQ